MERFFLTPVVAVLLATASAHAQGIGVGFDPTDGDTIETGSNITINNQSGGNCSGQWSLNGEPVGDPFPVSPGASNTSAPPVPGEFTLTVSNGSGSNSATYNVVQGS